MRLWIAMLACACMAQAEDLAFTGVTVVDTERGCARPGMTVLISGDRISAVGDSGRLKPPEGARVMDGRGKFLIPGLWDMHVHMLANWDPAVVDDALDVLCPELRGERHHRGPRHVGQPAHDSEVA